MTIEKTYLQEMLALSEAAYTSPLVLPASYAAPQPILADPAASCALLDKTNLCFGYVTAKDGMTYIVFRGTENPEEWADDGYALLVSHWKAGRVHKGFRDVYSALRDSISMAVAAAVDSSRTRLDSTIAVIGHSLGAALATLCAVDYPAYQVDLVTFAGPRVGNAEFADMVEASTRTHLRVVNTRDIVTHIPPRPGYSHAGGTVSFAGKSLVWKTAHSEPLSYAPGIAALTEPILTAPNRR